MDRKSDYIDITVPLSDQLPIWPGSRGISKSTKRESFDNYIVHNTRLDCDVHTGTHVDAHYHFIEGGKTVEQLSLEVLCGATTVAEIKGDLVTDEDLDALNLPGHVERLLVKTKNSRLWANAGNVFEENYVGLTAGAAEWVVNKGIKLVGIDYLSIQLFRDSPATHQILLGAEIIVVEGVDLSEVPPGEYDLICLPLKLVGSDGAPARVLLKNIL